MTDLKLLGRRLVAAGALGLALADYPGFRQEGFEISALFDNLKEKVGQQSKSGVPIYDINDPARRPVSDFELGQPGEGDVK